jgi:hypothetical protein
MEFALKWVPSATECASPERAALPAGCGPIEKISQIRPETGLSSSILSLGVFPYKRHDIDIT